MNMLTIKVPLTVTVPVAGEMLGIGEKAAYAAVSRGEIPSLRLGRRLVIPVHKLLELVGASPEPAGADPGTGSATASIQPLTPARSGGTQHDVPPAA